MKRVSSIGVVVDRQGSMAGVIARLWVLEDGDSTQPSSYRLPNPVRGEGAVQCVCLANVNHARAPDLELKFVISE